MHWDLALYTLVYELYLFLVTSIRSGRRKLKIGEFHGNLKICLSWNWRRPLHRSSCWITKRGIYKGTTCWRKRPAQQQFLSLPKGMLYMESTRQWWWPAFLHWVRGLNSLQPAKLMMWILSKVFPHPQLNIFLAHIHMDRYTWSRTSFFAVLHMIFAMSV